jgi:hypothetical protein
MYDIRGLNLKRLSKEDVLFGMESGKEYVLCLKTGEGLFRLRFRDYIYGHKTGWIDLDFTYKRIYYYCNLSDCYAEDYQQDRYFMEILK